jgi:hypothetical protein
MLTLRCSPDADGGLAPIAVAPNLGTASNDKRKRPSISNVSIALLHVIGVAMM